MSLPTGQIWALPDDDTGYGGVWTDVVEISRQPSPPIPSKRARLTLDDQWAEFRRQSEANGPYADPHHGHPTQEAWQNPSFNNSQRLQRTPESLGALSASLTADGKKTMQTGCIPCLIKGVPCDRRNPGCRRAISSDWNLNYDEEIDKETGLLTPSNGTSLTIFRPDVKWRRSWRERHSLNFFVNFSAPQMAGFFDSSFWQRMVIQTSYHEPAILHAITAIGALHECIMQRAYADDKRKARAIEFALNQCNKAINHLVSAQTDTMSLDFSAQSSRTPNSRLALTTCVLFTCFEAMQGRCDSAVGHALQGRRLLSATGRPNVETMTPAEEDDLEQMRPIVERLEVQATALLDKRRQSDDDSPVRSPPLPLIEHIFSLEHAHNTLHTALNSIMRFMQGFQPNGERSTIAYTMEEKERRYGPWFATWEQAFSKYLAQTREKMTNMDLKRAMVLKANHLVGTMLSSVDQSAGPAAYDAYENEFKAVVDLSREVLSSFSCPPLPTLSGGSSGTPYLSFSLWVTDPLWMAISRCRHPSIRQAAFTLLSQNPRQEGIWHAGPQTSTKPTAKRTDTSPRETKRSASPPEAKNVKRKYESSEQKQCPNGTNGTNGANGTYGSSTSTHSNSTSPPQHEVGSVPWDVEAAPIGGNMRGRGDWIELQTALERAHADELASEPSQSQRHHSLMSTSGLHTERAAFEACRSLPTPMSEATPIEIPQNCESLYQSDYTIPTKTQIYEQDPTNGEFVGWGAVGD